MTEGNNSPHKKRIVPPFVPPDTNAPIFQLQLTSNGEYLIHAPGLGSPQIIQILFGAITQAMFATFQQLDKPSIVMPPVGMQVPKNE